ncbi:hypothetical protein [Synechococcus sp. BMK-MC-1]|uniref:hypothetical protein n=1 Tax=Synechococcus sp. BMK-MC-1 TaxID=1442551 RepID=UPI0016493FCA|nr:hypothetical protein [Synechococcus sp. BMK-MC-1]
MPAVNILKPDTNKHATRSCGCEKGGGITLEIGSKFGRLIVIGKGQANWKYSRRAWKCKCDCGAEIVVSTKNLLSGHAKSCGCLSADLASERRLDITGERYGRLVAIKRLPDNQQRKDSEGYFVGDWQWQCDCGNTHVAKIGTVRAGNTRSCGCLGREQGPLNFHNEGHLAYAEDPEYAARESLLYLVEICGSVDKIGIAFDLESRFQSHEVTEIWWTNTMSRAECWAVEQVALNYTLSNKVKNPPENLKRGGVTELREGLIIDETICLLEELCDEAKELGWREFYDKNLL